MKTLKFVIATMLCITLCFSVFTLATAQEVRRTGLDITKAPSVRISSQDISLSDDGRALPRRHDWRELGGVTPVRDQGDAGTCWAFATTGPLEHAIKIKDRVDVDLSEQFLVAYNEEGYGVDGGWFAHDYHKKPGAVLEFDFPYTANEIPVWNNPEYNHPYKIKKWSYNSFYTMSVATSRSMKKAIYKHGSVAAAVYADNTFIRYKGGIYKGVKNSEQINHAVMLVGWDDLQGVWILKNSWSTDWGENGYMRIKYGANKIGFAANYIVY
jgi:C1A family cysteine protease